MAVARRTRLVTCLGVLAIVVEPVIGWTVGKQEVRRSAMVEDDVLDDLDATLVCFVHKRAIVLVCAQTRICLVVVRDGIAMIRLLGHVVLQGGGWPDGRDAQGPDVRLQQQSTASYTLGGGSSKKHTS